MTKAEKTAEAKTRIHRIGKSLASWRFYLAHSGQGDKTPGGASKAKLSAKRIAEVKATMAKLEAERTKLRATLPEAQKAGAPKPKPAAKKVSEAEEVDEAGEDDGLVEPTAEEVEGMLAEADEALAETGVEVEAD